MNIKNISDITIKDKHNPVVFVSGGTGQDGSHMIDYLLRETSASVVAGVRLLSTENHTNTSHLKDSDRLQFVNFDLTDSHSVYRIVEQINPDYFINLAAQSFVHGSWDIARNTWQTNSTSVLDCLEAIRQIKPTCRFYNAGSSEEFGNVLYDPQDENHPPHPRSPYGASKCAARTLIKVYRESYGLYAVQGWLFNHEGTRRGKKFVTRKITTNVARIKKSIDDFESGKTSELNFSPLELGNVDAKRDWSDAEDMVDGIWRMLNQDKFRTDLWKYKSDGSIDMNHTVSIRDYVCSSDENHTIREFVEESFKCVGISGMWIGKGVNEQFQQVVSCSVAPGKTLVTINPTFYRPAEVEILRGDSSKIRTELGWSPKTTFKELVKKMVLNDVNQLNG